MTTIRTALPRLFVLSVVSGLAPGALAVVTTFDNGLEGWSISGRTTILPTGGNPGANLGPLVTDVFGIDIRNNTNAAFLGNYSQFWQTNGGGPGAPLRLSIDTKTNSIDFFGSQISRNLIVELRDYTNPPPNYPYVSVWYNLGTIAASLPGWRTFSIDIVNKTARPCPVGGAARVTKTPRPTRACPRIARSQACSQAWTRFRSRRSSPDSSTASPTSTCRWTTRR